MLKTLKLNGGCKLPLDRAFKLLSENFILKKVFALKTMIMPSARKCSKKQIFFLSAFTLAETLIVMGIIGVVAALTIPNLTQSTGEKEKVAKLKKIHSNLEDAFGRATAVYGTIDTWFVNDFYAIDINKRFAERMLDFIKVTKNCGTSTNATCFTNGKSKNLQGAESEDYNVRQGYKIILADNSSIAFDLQIPNCDFADMAASADSYLKNLCGFIWVDIDGPNKGSYTMGKDIFSFVIAKTGIYPFDKNSILLSSDDLLKTNCFVNGGSCSGWVIENGNMDYLKATNGTCPNGTVLNWTNTSCK